MANELRHSDVGTALSKSEWEGVGNHVLNSQAAGDIIYASSTSQLSRLGIGSANQILQTNSGASAPEWTTNLTIGSTVVSDDSIVMTPSTSDTVTIAAATNGILNITTVDAAGTAADVNIDADGEIVIDPADAAGTIFKIAGTAQLSVVDGSITPTSNNDIDLGTASYQFKDAYIDGTLEADAITIGGTNVVTGSLITTLGTISAGTWQGTAIAAAYIAADAITGAKIADDAIDSEHYTDGSIDTAHIADDQVTLAKMAGLTRGSIIYGNASGNPTALGVGSANYVIKSDGTDIAWAAQTDTTYSAGTLLDLSSTTFNVDLSEAAAATMASADEFIFLDNDASSAAKRESLSDLLDTIAGTVATTGLDRSGATLVVSDLHPVGVSGSNNQLITDDGDGTVTSESNLTFSGTVLTVTGSVDTTLDQHFDSSPADETVSGITATFTAGEALERGEVVYFKAADSKMWKAVATAAATSNCVAMAAADISADATGKFLLQGFLADNGTFPAYTVGGVLYTPEAEQNSQNVPEQTAPDTDGDFVQIIGWAVTANSVYFKPDSAIVEIA